MDRAEIRRFTGGAGDADAVVVGFDDRGNSSRKKRWPTYKAHRVPKPETLESQLDLAVEVLSPSTARADRQVKRRLYAELADEYWIVDLDGRVVERWRAGDERPEILADRLAWQPAADATPLELDLAEYFGEVLAP